MNDLTLPAGASAERLANMPRRDIDRFVRERIAEKALSPIIRQLNVGMLSGDPRQRATAEKALRQMGFL